MFERIVVGYGSDRAGRDAVALAARLAGPLGSSIAIAFPYHPLLASITAEEAERQVREDVCAHAGETAAFRSASCHWSPSSWPIRALHELAGYEQGRLLVFGAAREGLADHLHLSLMERMVHGAPCAVAVAPTGYADHPPSALRHIGLGFADSPEGPAAMHLARDLAAALHGDLELISGCGLNPALAGYARGSPALPEVERDLQAETEAQLQRAAEELGEEVPLTLAARRGVPAEVLVDRSAELDLLVLGSRSYGPLRHALLGGVSARVMREARCPVLVAPRGTGGRASEPS